MKYSSLTNRVKGKASDVWDSHYAARAAKDRGEDVIILSVGDPDFSTPELIVDAAIKALREGDTHYTHQSGIDALRQCIAQRQRQKSAQAVTAENVIVCSGAQNALFSTSLCLFDHGDEVIVLQPMYVTYEATIQSSGATLIPVVLDAQSGFRLDADSLKAAITPRTRAIYFATPSNPTGIALSHVELAIIAGVAIANDLWVVSDEVYSDLVFESEFFHIASLPGMAERCVTIGSMSKSYAMTGWRVGWAIAPAELIESMGKLALCMLYGLPGFIQQAALHALQHGGSKVATMRDVYRRRRDLLLKEINSISGLKALKPDAGMFLMVDIRGTGLTSPQFVTRLLQQQGVSVLDATAFGDSAAGYVRLSYSVDDEDLIEASKRMRTMVESL